jgi:hypothetical protein
MKLIDESLYQESDGSINLWNRLQGTLNYGPSWYNDMQAQQKIVEQLDRVLDQRYVVLRNVILPGTDVPIPLILIGPGGIWVMLVSTMRGVFRAKGESWATVEGSRVKAARPNMINRVQLMVRALETHLQKAGQPVSEIHPALLFTNPGMHVDAVNPIVRVVLSDAIERFINSLTQEKVIYPIEKIQRLVQALAKQEPQSAPAAGKFALREKEDVFSFREVEVDEAEDEFVVVNRGPSALDLFAARINLTTRQLVILGWVFGIWLVILLGFLIFLLFFS